MAWPSKARTPLADLRYWAASLALCISLAGLGACPALATPNNEVNKKRLESTVRFLQNAQNSDGGFSAGGNVGEPSNPEFSAWASVALAAAGINPQNQARPGGESAYGYLAAHAPSESAATTEFERVLLVVDAADTSPQDFGGVNLVERILARKLPQGGFSSENGQDTARVNATVFAIIALSPIQEPAVQHAVAAAADWLEEQQSEGSWPAECPKSVTSCASEPEGEVDMTAAAIEALNAAGIHESEAQSKAFAYLRGAQDPDGGFPEFTDKRESNTASTSWAVQAIWSAGENPETWTQQSSGKQPLEYLESMQHEDGSIQSSASSDENPMWMTAYAAPAFAGQPLPVPAVPLEVPNTTPTTASGVIAGGGGSGAPLFSHPQPQSQGSTPGGVRLLHGTRGRARARTAGDHGREPQHHAPVLTITNAVASTKPASHRSARPQHGSGSAKAGSGDGGERASGQEVRGLLINAPGSAHQDDALEPGAPGLRSASAGASQTPWLAIAIGGLIAMLVLGGSQLERRRPQVMV